MRSAVPALLLLLLSVPPRPAHAAERTTADLLRRMIDVDRLADPPPPGERSLLFSSYDRRQREIVDGRYAHWDADNDAGNFLGKTDDGWDILAEVDGPGTITRIWCDQPAGQVRIEIDGQAAIDAEFVSLFDGGVAPFGEPLSYFVADNHRGANLYYPIGFAERCRVLSRGFHGAYQIDATAFAPDTRVEPFQSFLSDEAQQALDEVIAAMRGGLTEQRVAGGPHVMTLAAQQDLGPGEIFSEPPRASDASASASTGKARKQRDSSSSGQDGAASAMPPLSAPHPFDKPGTIRALMIALTDRTGPRDMYALHQCVIRLYWDGQEQPAVELPLASLFGTGFDRNPYNSLVMGTDRWLDLPGQFPTESRFMYCLLPLPFQKARLEIENLNASKIGLMVYLRVDTTPPAADRLRFRASVRIEDPCKVFDLPLLETTAGPGRIVGCVLNIDTPRAEWWGRGDHKVWLDGETFPSLLGTGTDGYFGNVEGLAQVGRALHGASLVNPHGKNSLYRWQLADAIAFQRGARFMIENWQPRGANDVYYGAVLYWYGPPGPGGARPDGRLTRETLALPGLRIPGSVEVEGHIAGDGWGTLLRQKYAGGVELSGEAAANITTEQPVEIELPCEAAGKYRLSLRVHPRRSFERIEVTLASGEPIGTVTYARRDDGLFPVGDVHLEAATNRLRVTCSKPATLDCWVLERID